MAPVRATHYRWPAGGSYQHYAAHMRLPRDYWIAEYFIEDFADYGLDTPPAGYEWVRYGPDMLLINLDTGEVTDAVYGAFDESTPPDDSQGDKPPPDRQGQPQAANAGSGADATDGPFGIAMGTPISELHVSDDKRGPGEYILKELPKPNREFYLVQVLALPETGVCEIQAWTPFNASDGLGIHVMQTIDNIANELQTKYGAPEKYNICIDADCKNTEFASELATGERHYMYNWRATDGHPLPNNVKFISLWATVMNGATAATLGYQFTNFDRCNELANQAGASSL